jgi:hypothetical protein
VNVPTHIAHDDVAIRMLARRRELIGEEAVAGDAAAMVGDLGEDGSVGADSVGAGGVGGGGGGVGVQTSESSSSQGLNDVAPAPPGRAIPSRFANRGKGEPSAEEKQAKIDGRNQRSHTHIYVQIDLHAPTHTNTHTHTHTHTHIHTHTRTCTHNKGCRASKGACS